MICWYLMQTDLIESANNVKCWLGMTLLRTHGEFAKTRNGKCQGSRLCV